MRLVIDDRLGERHAGAVSTLKRIERELAEELTGCVGLVDVSSLPVEDALAAGIDYVGLQAAPEREISREQAREVIAALIECDLAYHAPRRSKAAASSLASTFLAMFPGADARFFTNGELGLEHVAGRSGAWAPLTNATFDTGVVAIDGARMGVFWVEDED
jgi:hypothetical protein